MILGEIKVKWEAKFDSKQLSDGNNMQMISSKSG